MIARLGAVALALAGVYWVTANAWMVFSWGPTMTEFEGLPRESRSSQVVTFLVYGAPGLLILAASVWIWRATRKPSRGFSAKPS